MRDGIGSVRNGAGHGSDALDPFRPLDDAERLEQYGRLRSLAPAVHVESRDVWVVSRHEAVRRVLRSSDDFVSGLGTGFVPAAVERHPRPAHRQRSA